MEGLQPTHRLVNRLNMPWLSRGELIARVIDGADDREVRAYQRLRYDCFVLRKGWVCADPRQPGRETDRYDEFCHHLGVFQGGRMVAYLRALPWQVVPGFMLEHEFQALLPKAHTTKQPAEGDVELSRLIVTASTNDGPIERIAVAELLFKLVYHLGKRCGWVGYYIVLEEPWLRILNRRFNLPFARLGLPHTYPDGTKTLAAYVRCATIEQSMLETSPSKYCWYQKTVTE